MKDHLEAALNLFKKLWGFLYADYYPMGEIFDGPIPTQWLQMAKELGVDRNATFREFFLALERAPQNKFVTKMDPVKQSNYLIKVKAILDSVEDDIL